MAQLKARKDGAHLTIHEKRLVAESMYAKGKGFLGAAIILRQKGQYEYVVLHLLCQGIECTLKGLLLLKDYDYYKPQLKKDFGHHLDQLADATVKAFGLNPIAVPLASELNAMSSLYSSHLLRYGTFYDVLVDPSTIPSGRAWRRVAAAVRLAERHIRQSSGAYSASLGEHLGDRM